MKLADVLQIDVLVCIKVEARTGGSDESAAGPGCARVELNVVDEVDPAVLVAVAWGLPDP